MAVRGGSYRDQTRHESPQPTPQRGVRRLHTAEPLCPTQFGPVPSPPTEEAVEGSQDSGEEQAQAEELEGDVEEAEEPE